MRIKVLLSERNQTDQIINHLQEKFQESLLYNKALEYLKKSWYLQPIKEEGQLYLYKINKMIK